MPTRRPSAVAAEPAMSQPPSAIIPRFRATITVRATPCWISRHRTRPRPNLRECLSSRRVTPANTRNGRSVQPFESYYTRSRQVVCGHVRESPAPPGIEQWDIVPEKLTQEGLLIRVRCLTTSNPPGPCQVNDRLDAVEGLLDGGLVADVALDQLEEAVLAAGQADRGRRSEASRGRGRGGPGPGAWERASSRRSRHPR